MIVLYECGICDSLHPWRWAGDCRDNANRFADIEDYTARTGEQDIEIFSMDERISADLRGDL